MRVLDPSALPSSLWDGARGALRLPPLVSAAYLQLLKRRPDLVAYADAADDESGPVGGASLEDTERHLASRYPTSVARAQLAVLDPTGKVDRASDALLRLLSGGSLCIADAPCGAGAASLSLLATIAELRARSVLPRLPLEVTLIAADVSEHALQYAQALLGELTDDLEAQAIFVNGSFRRWDVLDRVSNTALIQEIVQKAPPFASRLILVANFTGFLERSGKRREAAPQIEELFRHCGVAKRAVAVWLEPGINIATKGGGFFPWLLSAVAKWTGFAKVNTQGVASDQMLMANAHFCAPRDESTLHRVALAFVRLDLGIGNDDPPA